MKVTKVYESNGKYVGYFTEKQTGEQSKWLAENPDWHTEDGDVDYSEADLCYYINKPIPEQQKVLDGCTVSDLLFLLAHEKTAFIVDGKIDYMATKFMELTDRCPEYLLYCQLP